MNTIELVVGGQTYAISCERGEEDHVRSLGAAIDAKFQQIAPRYAQNLLFASLQLADELHEAGKATAAAQRDKKQIAEAFDAYRADMAEQRRDADTALGQRDQLKSQISELERELDRMQSAQQGAMEETADIRRELSDLRNKEADWEALENNLRAQIADLSATVENAAGNGGSAAGSSVPVDDLHPALERFAQMLEETADKLEQRHHHP